MFKNVCKVVVVILCSALVCSSVNAQEKTTWKMQPTPIQTRWAKSVSPENALQEYPRPQMVRGNWQNLNGLWEYAITQKDSSAPLNFYGHILVPFPIESALSGVKRQLTPSENIWYRRKFSKPIVKDGQKLLLNFGAVDWKATVYINDIEVGIHIGGYTNFSIDITKQLREGENVILVKVFDPTDQGIGPHGKQVLSPSSIYYTASSGIWQTVWLEIVPATHITDLKFTPDIDERKLDLRVNLSSIFPAKSEIASRYSIEVVVLSEGKEILKQVQNESKGNTMYLKIPNIRLWSPEDPFLYDLTVRLKYKGKVVDEAQSYFGMRKIGINKDTNGIERIFLNNKPYFNLGTLDQGFWPEGLYTAPTDSALKFDIQAIKAMGFNTIRKHIKVEPARWYYHADKLGVLVWQDLVNPNQGLPDGAKEEFERESAEILTQLHNSLCITTWVLFNEKWGQYDQQRLTKWLKATDPSRLINGHSGEYLYVNEILRSPSPNAYENADLTDVHSYPDPRMSIKDNLKAQVCGEFGGIGVPIEGHLWNDLVAGWGYDGVVTPETLKVQYSSMIEKLTNLKTEGLSGSIYTQPFDVESEQNGLMTYDREIVKLSFDTIKAINAKLALVSNTMYSITAQIAPIKYPSYTDRVKCFQQGQKDSSFLRSLTILAAENRDTSMVEEASKVYCNIIKDPLSRSNLDFFLKFSCTTTSIGFSIVLNNQDKLNEYLDSRVVSNKIQEIIFNQEVKPILNDKPNWFIIDNIIKKYSQVNGELIIGMSVVHYFNLNHENAINNAVHIASVYDKRYNSGAYNSWAWRTFKYSSSVDNLKIALEWSKKELARSDSSKPEFGMYLDTYANILYKLGRKREAMEVEEKAIRMVPDNKEMLENFEKMKKGINTWQ